MLGRRHHFAGALVTAAFAIGVSVDARAQSGAQVSVVPPTEIAAATPGISSAAATASVSRFDEGLAQQLAARLAADPSLAGAALTVSARDGNLTVNGSTVDSVQAARVQQVASAVAGVGHASTNLAARRP